MNILLITTGFPERGQPATGFPNYLYRVSLSLIQMGHTPIILSSGLHNACRFEKGIEIRMVEVHRYDVCKSQPVNYLVNALRKGYALNRKIGELIRERQIDIIQFTSLEGIAAFYYGNVPAVMRLSSYAKTAFATFQTHTPETVKAMSFLERLSARRCSAIFAPCRKNAQIFGRDCGRKVKVIETPFVNDVEEYDYRYVEDHLRGKKYVLFFGTLYAEKGILIIAEILEKFLEDNQNYHFVFIGNIGTVRGESCSKILRRKAGKCADRVLIGGELSHDQLYPVIRQADFIVLPSLMENLSNACIEAMYFEKVVIGTDGASFEQLITHGKNGLLCRIGDPEDLLKKMQAAASMTDKQKLRMGKNAGKRIEKLRPECAVRKLLSFYQYVIESSIKEKEKIR